MPLTATPRIKGLLKTKNSTSKGTNIIMQHAIFMGGLLIVVVVEKLIV